MSLLLLSCNPTFVRSKLDQRRQRRQKQHGYREDGQRATARVMRSTQDGKTRQDKTTQTNNITSKEHQHSMTQRQRQDYTTQRPTTNDIDNDKTTQRQIHTTQQTTLHRTPQHNNKIRLQQRTTRHRSSKNTDTTRHQNYRTVGDRPALPVPPRHKTRSSKTQAKLRCPDTSQRQRDKTIRDKGETREQHRQEKTKQDTRQLPKTREYETRH